MTRGYGWLPRHDIDRASLMTHRRMHRASVMASARAHDDAGRSAEQELERLLDDVDAAIRAGMNEAPEQQVLRHSGEWKALAEPEYWSDWRDEHAAAEPSGAVAGATDHS